MSKLSETDPTQTRRTTRPPWEDCNTTGLPYYTPIQAAIRWCGLTDKEPSILDSRADQGVYVHQGEFPEYPCLFVHSENIRIAMMTNKLRHGRNGNSIDATEHVTPEKRTVAHDDLKAWIRKEHPADARKAHMAWLFDDVERSIHPAITTDAYNALKAERDALKREVESLKQQAPRATPTDTDARLKVVAGLVEACGLNIRTTTAADVQRKLEETGYAVSPDTCERMLSPVRKRLPFWTD